MKVRVANATQSRYLSGLGAVIVPIPATEARDAIEKGVADAMLFPWQSLTIFGIDNLLTYHMDVPFAGNAFEMMFNRNSYDKLTPNQKKVLDDHCTAEWSARFISAWNDMEANGKAALAAKPGHVVYPVSEQFMTNARAAAEPVKKEWADSVRKAGYDPDQLWSGLIAAERKYKAN